MAPPSVTIRRLLEKGPSHSALRQGSYSGGKGNGEEGREP